MGLSIRWGLNGLDLSPRYTVMVLDRYPIGLIIDSSGAELQTMFFGWFRQIIL